ncbi:MAG: efflux RND transporter permease subunit, partial [Pseudomonadota bacterium]|nr:efflux RND transporter permease subunit [Pseudomonadota bacterium]
MSPSRPFILRPVATSLLMLAIVLAGLVGFKFLPLSALPEVDYPTIQVQTLYPGASPEVMGNTVTAPLERNFGQMAGLQRMSSTSAAGASIITLQFTLGTSLDVAEQEVQAAINASGSLLPADLPAPPIYAKVNPADAPVLTLAISSDTLRLTEVQNLVNTRLAQKISQVPGVGLVTLAGGQRPAVRIQADTQALASYGIGIDTLRTAIAAANANSAKGSFDGPRRAYSINANDQLLTADDYRKLIVAYKNGAPVRLVNVAQVVESAENVRLGAWAGKTCNADDDAAARERAAAAPASGGRRGKPLAGGIACDARVGQVLQPAIILNVQRQPGANVIATTNAIKQQLPDLQAGLPGNIQVDVLVDRTTGIRASVEHVEIELVLAVVMVVLVIFAFLGSVRATVIASIAVPISLIGTCGAMYLLHYSLNNLSLMALTIATGFVVDDAIVMIENISRHVELARRRLASMPGAAPASIPIDAAELGGAEAEGLPEGRQRLVLEAAMAGASEIGFTIISLTVSLVAVLIPLLFMGDVVGRLFREFAVTLAITILISAVVSLTLVPMMSARWLKPKDENRPKRAGSLAARFQRFFDGVMQRYDGALNWVIDRQALTLGVAVGTLALTVLLYLFIPKGLFPTQDTGQLQGRVDSAADVSFERMGELQQATARAILADPAVANLSAFIGVDAANNTMLHTGRMLINLKPSHGDQAAVMDRLRRRASDVAGVVLYLQPTQDLTIDAESGPTQYRVSLEGADTATVTAWVNKLVAQMQASAKLRNVTSDAGITGLAAFINIDRDTAARLGVTASAVDDALYSAFGQRIVSTIFTETNQYRVILEAQPGLLTTAESLGKLNLRTSSGEPTPLDAIARISERRAPLQITHVAQYPASTIGFDTAPGVSLGAAVDSIRGAAKAINLPSSVQLTFLGASGAYERSLSNQLWLILAAVVCVYIVLGVLYESYVHPLT